MVFCFQILSTDVTDHLGEFATLKAIGYSNLYLVGVVLQEALLLGAVSGLMRATRDRRITRVEATVEAEAEWSRHIEELADGMLYTQIDSWATGINSNVEGRNVRRILQYQGGAPAYRARCDEVAANNYVGTVLS